MSTRDGKPSIVGNAAFLALFAFSAAVFAEKSEKHEVKATVSAVQPEREKSEGEKWSEKRHDCWVKYQSQIAEKTRSLSAEYDSAQQKVAELYGRLSKSDPVLDSLNRQESALRGSKETEKLKNEKMQAILHCRMERQSAINENPELKSLMERLKTKSSELQRVMADIPGKDMACSEILLGSQKGGAK